MKLNEDQHLKLQSVFISAGLNLAEFCERWTNEEYFIAHKTEPSIRLIINSKSIQGRAFGDMFCDPYTYQKTMYMECDTFEDCLKLARDWAVVSKYKLMRKPYYHKVFISHSSKDKPIIDEFVDKVLRLSCGFKTSEIVYTSREDTGVELGDGIPQFIKENIISSSLVLFMISKNYKQSEVCLNEMGAAWALEKNIVSVVLPDCDFDSLGWLTSLNKAVKINSRDGLDKLYSMLVRTEQNVVDWNRQKEGFLRFCAEGDIHNSESGSNIDTSSTPIVHEDSLRIFDENFRLRCKTEGEFQYQVDLRLRALKSITLRKVYLKNDNEFVDDVSNPSKILSLMKFIPRGMLSMPEIEIDMLKNIVDEAFKKKFIDVQDFEISKDSQQSLTFIGGFETIRECDGYMDLPINHWSLCIEYNIDEMVSIPLTADIIKTGGCNCFWHN